MPYWAEGFDTSPCSLPPRWLYEPSCDTGLYRQVIGSSGNGIGLHTTPTSYGPNSSSQMTSAWTPDAHQSAGSTTWYSTRMLLPSCCYQPTNGEWNWLVEWHDDDTTQALGANSDALGVFAYTGAAPFLVLRLGYGLAASPTYDDTTCRVPGPVLYDHWYTLEFGFTWSSLTGTTIFRVDGAQVCNTPVPTLYIRPDGSVSSINSFGLYNYHHADGYDMEARFDTVKVGPSLASVS